LQGSLGTIGNFFGRRRGTRHAWLRYFKFSTNNAVSIADAHIVIGKSLDSEVFAELAESKTTTAQKTLSVMGRIHLVDE
jgi:hypothetical protein